MATFTLPIAEDSIDFEQFTELDGREFIMRFRYQSKDDAWYLDISDHDETPLVMGLKIVLGVLLLRPYQADVRLPPGDLFALAPSGGGDPGAGALGSRVLVVYESAAV